MQSSVLYARTSTHEQKEKNTIEIQRQAADAYREVYNLGGEYLDDGVSGTTPFEERPGGAQLLKDAAKGAFNHVVVNKIDRFGRKASVIHHAVEKLKQYGVTFSSIQEKVDTSTPFGEAFFNLLAVFAQLERDMILERTSAGREIAIVQRKVWPGAMVPFGYQLDEARQLAPATDVIPGTRHSEVDVVRQIFSLTVNERRGSYWIANWLNNNGIPTSTYREDRAKYRRSENGSIWSPTGVVAVLANPIYSGKFYYGKHKQEVPVPPLVSEETYLAAAIVRQQNGAMAKRNNKYDYLLSGLIRCRVCDSQRLFVGRRRDNKEKTRIYACGRRWSTSLRQEDRCSAQPLEAEALERYVWETIRAWVEDPAEAIAEAREHLNTASEDEEALRAELASVEERLLACDQAENEVMALFDRKLIKFERLQQSLTLNQMDRLVNEERRAEILGGLASASERMAGLNSVERYLADLSSWLDEGITFAQRQSIVRMLVKQIDVFEREGEQQVRIIFRFGQPSPTRAIATDTSWSDDCNCPVSITRVLRYEV